MKLDSTSVLALIGAAVAFVVLTRRTGSAAPATEFVVGDQIQTVGAAGPILNGSCIQITDVIFDDATGETLYRFIDSTGATGSTSQGFLDVYRLNGGEVLSCQL